MSIRDRRKAERIRFTSRIVITLPDRELEATADARNISLNGMYLEARETLPPGTRCILTVTLSGDSSQMAFQVNGMVCRCEPEGMAVEFCRLDTDTFVHLKNLIRLLRESGNSGPAGKI